MPICEIRWLFANRYAVADFAEERGYLVIVRSLRQLIKLIYSYTSRGYTVKVYGDP